MLKCGCLRMIRIENLCQAGLRACPDRDHLPHCHPLHSGPCKGSRITAHHIRQADTLEFAKAGTMERELDKIFRD